MPHTPFLNTALSVILFQGLFKGKTSLYRLFPEEFEGKPNKKEMSPVLVALATMFVGDLDVPHAYDC